MHMRNINSDDRTASGRKPTNRLSLGGPSQEESTYGTRTRSSSLGTFDHHGSVRPYRVPESPARGINESSTRRTPLRQHSQPTSANVVAPRKSSSTRPRTRAATAAAAAAAAARSTDSSSTTTSSSEDEIQVRQNRGRSVRRPIRGGRTSRRGRDRGDDDNENNDNNDDDDDDDDSDSGDRDDDGDDDSEEDDNENDDSEKDSDNDSDSDDDVRTGRGRGRIRTFNGRPIRGRKTVRGGGGRGAVRASGRGQAQDDSDSDNSEDHVTRGGTASLRGRGRAGGRGQRRSHPTRGGKAPRAEFRRAARAAGGDEDDDSSESPDTGGSSNSNNSNSDGDGASDNDSRDASNVEERPPRTAAASRATEPRKGSSPPPAGRRTPSMEQRAREWPAVPRRRPATAQPPAQVPVATQRPTQVRLRLSFVDGDNPRGEVRTDADVRRVPIPVMPVALRRSPTAHTPGVAQAPPVRAINPTHLTGVHDWVVGQTTPRTRGYAGDVYDNNNDRTDMERFRAMENTQGRRDAAAEFHFFATQHRWFRIPSSIRSDRTYARDEQEATYVDHMDSYLARVCADAFGINMRNLPLVATGDALQSRWWNRFEQHRNFVIEAIWRFVHGVMISADAETVDTVTTNIAEYLRLFPSTPWWLEERYFPPGVPTPTPPSVFYYHREMVGTRGARLCGVWERIVEFEWVALYAAAWWHEAFRGRRAWVLPAETIDWLRDRLDDIVMDPDTRFGPDGTQTTANTILEAMEVAAATDADTERNTVYFTGTRLRPNQFVWTTRGTATFDPSAVAGRQFVRQVSGGGRLIEMNVMPDPAGYAPRLNHNRRQPAQLPGPAPQRRRVGGRWSHAYRAVPASPAPEVEAQQGHGNGRVVGFGTHPSWSQRIEYREYSGPMHPHHAVRPNQEAQHVQDAVAPAAAGPAHQHLRDPRARSDGFWGAVPAEEGPEEVYIDEWRRRYGVEPDPKEWLNSRTTTPVEYVAIQNGQLPRWSQPRRVIVGMRPHLVVPSPADVAVARAQRVPSVHGRRRRREGGGEGDRGLVRRT